jgi:hypothetical protein
MLNIFCHVVLVNKHKVSEKNFPDLGTDYIHIMDPTENISYCLRWQFANTTLETMCLDKQEGLKIPTSYLTCSSSQLCVVML